MAVTIDGTNGITSPDFEPSSSTTPTNGLFLPAANTVGLATGSTERLRIDSSGNLGLGISSPLAKANIVSAGAALGGTAQLAIGASSNNYDNTYLRIDNSGNSNFCLDQILGGVSYNRLFIERTTGNVGIGTSSPGAKLELSTGTATKLRITSTVDNNADIDFYTNGVYRGIIEGNSLGMLFGTTGALPCTFITNNSERMRIDSSGNLLVGTTTIGYTSSNSTYYQPAAAYWINNHITGTAGGTRYIGFGLATAELGSITQNSTTGVLYNTSSDKRLKENIVNSPSALSSVNAIKIRSFDWKSDGSHVDYGYIAQELLEVAPEAVSVPADPDEMMGVDFGKLTPRLVKAIQELTARLEALEAK